MPNKTFTDLSIATTSDGTELIPVVSSGSTRSVSVSTLNSSVIAETMSDVSSAEELSIGQSSIAAAAASLVSGITQQDLTGVNTVGLHRSPNAITSMFIYDTSKDSDGGAWTEKCQNTSWYNEAMSGKWLGAFPSETIARAYDTITSGNELIVNGNFTTDTNGWTLGGTATGKAMSSSNGALLLERSGGNGTVYAYQAITTIVGKTYRVSGSVLNVNGPNLAGFIAYQTLGGTVLGSDYRNVSNTLSVGQYSFTFTATTATTYIVAQLDNNTNGSVLYDAISVLEVSSWSSQSNDYYQSSADGKFYRLWRNLLAYSDQFDNSYWPTSIAGSSRNTTVFSNTLTDPIGGNSADKLIPNTVNAQHFIGANNFSISGLFVGSIYVKAAEYSKCLLGLRSSGPTIYINNCFATFDLLAKTATANGTAIPTITDVGNGWFRITITTSAPISDFRDLVFGVVDNSGNTTFAGDGNSGIYIWGAQLEQGSVATTYEPKTTAGTISEVFRGNKRSFPKLSAIVAESGSVTIYDLTEPGRPMWMRFVRSTSGSTSTYLSNSGATVAAVMALNGRMAAGGAGGLAYLSVDFVREVAATKTINTSTKRFGGIAQRNVEFTTNGNPDGEGFIANSTINAVAMTVLPDAPVDPVTGLKVPTIAVATAGGVSVIKHSGTVVNSRNTGAYTTIALTPYALHTNAPGSAATWNIAAPLSSLVASFVLSGTLTQGQLASPEQATVKTLVPSRSKLFRMESNTSRMKIGNLNETGAYKSITVSLANVFNTGHMVGDIRRAYLADSVVGSVGPSTELVTNGTFDTDSSWTKSGAVTWSNGEYTIADVGGADAAITQSISGTVAGRTYRVEINITGNTGTSAAGFRVYINTAGAYVLSSPGITGVQSALITAPVDNFTVGLLTSGTDKAVTVTSISIKEVVADRSYKAQGASVTGTLTKTPVATGSQLVAYSGFSS